MVWKLGASWSLGLGLSPFPWLFPLALALFSLTLRPSLPTTIRGITITHIAAWFLWVWEIQKIKPIFTLSHFHFGINKGCSKPTGTWYYAFICWKKQTFWNELCNVSLLTIPSIMLFDVVVHFCTSRMHCIWRSMCLIKYFSPIHNH